ncbi:MAG: hypothetical protein HY538_04655 [Deltaproteobacteria bacterium]|nr:hypothetical protein [Deltaproteobacteria bacterium]
MVTTENPIHSGSGLELIRKLVGEGDLIFTVDRARALAPAVGLSNSYVSEALHHLAKGGWVVRLHRGLYAIASTVPGVTPAHDFEIAMALVNPAAISHWSALHHHGLTEQVPRTVFVLTTTDTEIPRLRGKRIAGRSGYPMSHTTYQFVRVKPERFFGTEKVWIGETRVTITDPERTLIDGLRMPQYCGDFAEVLHAFEMHGNHLNIDRIIEYALRLDAVIAKRLGWILERRGIEITRLQSLREVRVKDYRTLDPTGPRKGPCNRQWMIQQNLPGRMTR